jgi:UDP-N-acetylglucosamine 4,6-dehydratase/5-epimerase
MFLPKLGIPHSAFRILPIIPTDPPGLSRSVRRWNMDFYHGRKILVTGGTGSIGSQIVRQLISYQPRVLRILSRDETKQFHLEEELGPNGPPASVRFLIGDVRDPVRLRRAMEGIEIVFHAAAMKHVPACEYNPFEAVQTNVLGTQNVITAAREAGVERVVAVSTDKAASPENTMGATKLLAERLISSAHLSSPGQVLSGVRFGNVLGSRGSLVPRVLRQLAAGEPVTITHPQMTRFMMTIEDAVRLVLLAGARARGGEIFILKMPALRIRDLIEVLIDEHAARVGKSRAEFPIREIGIRLGEKLHEVLLTEEERWRTREEQEMFVLDPRAGDGPAGRRSAASVPERYDSGSAPLLDRAAIRGLLDRSGVFEPVEETAGVPG